MGNALSLCSIYWIHEFMCASCAESKNRVCVSCGENWVRSIREKGRSCCAEWIFICSQMSWKKGWQCVRGCLCATEAFAKSDFVLPRRCCLPLRKRGFARHETGFYTLCTVETRERGKSVTFTHFQRHVAVTIWWKSKKKIDIWNNKWQNGIV